MSDFVAGDTIPFLRVICRDQDGVLIDLTGFGVTVRWRYIPNGPMTKRATMTNDDQDTDDGLGGCRYRWGAGELIAPLIVYDCVIREVSSGRFVTQLDEVSLSIRPKAEDPDTSSSPSASRSPSASMSTSSSPSASPSNSPSPSSSPSGSASSSPSSSNSASPSASPSSSVSASPSAS